MAKPFADRLLKPEVLERIALLSCLSREELSELAGCMKVARYAKGEYVVIKGDREGALMFFAGWQAAGCRLHGRRQGNRAQPFLTRKLLRRADADRWFAALGIDHGH
jgi:hypothetical protein